MLIIDGHVCDSDLWFLRSVLETLDLRLAELDLAASKTTDPESSGICDPYEELCGVGFVTAQRYLAAVCGWYYVEKHIALKTGPEIGWGLTIAQIINSAANYWKHHDEWWTADPKPKMKRKDPLEAFGDSIGYDYPLSCILAGLSEQPYRLSKLVPKLEEWRYSVRKKGRPNQALQTTPMTRSVYEKTIEFERPQRGV